MLQFLKLIPITLGSNVQRPSKYVRVSEVVSSDRSLPTSMNNNSIASGRCGGDLDEDVV